MSMKDEKNGQIGMWKYWLSVAVASFLAISAFLVTHIKGVGKLVDYNQLSSPRGFVYIRCCFDFTH